MTKDQIQAARKSARTPGAWDAAEGQCGYFGRVISKSTQGTIAHCYSADDALLMAAAPDLLGALEEFVAWVNSPSPHSTKSTDMLQAAYEHARAALRKAQS